MPDADNTKSVDADVLSAAGGTPLVFISHDARDHELAEAFSKLLKSVSAGMIKTFRSSDKTGKEGIDFGDEWYKRLMGKLQSTSDVVCLFTERSLDRPWILFEAGVAKGKLNTPVVGVALGVPLTRVTTGPFYQFQNMDDSEADLSKLVHQLAKRVPSLELDNDVVKLQVQSFKNSAANILKSLGNSKKTVPENADDSPVAKLVEEMKGLPSRVVERLAESDIYRRRRSRRLHPRMIEDLLFKAGEPGDPVGILMVASLVRDDLPWLYELAMEVYRAAKTGSAERIDREIIRLRHFSDVVRRGPLEDLVGNEDGYMLAVELPRMLEHVLRRFIEAKRPSIRRKTAKAQPDQTASE
ncbi:MAG TPA: toll/interleukin-1 receptor domain-containing protein [Candidatus Bathyarchaeia archaeon]|jgi:hypothetical protein|nr:toll/interleukin-1 receptor domain-containing protein [Candidatus Bathyarchaeia archaeon]